MGRGALCIALIAAAFSLSGSAPQANGKSAQPQDKQTNAVAAVTTNQKTASAAVEKTKGCPGTQEPNLPCEAVSAKASEQQANQSVGYNWLFKVELVIGAITAAAAIAAAGFAARAASAARDTVGVLSEVERADIFVTLENFQYDNVFVRFDVIANNLGRSAALILSVALEWCRSKEVEDVGSFFPNLEPRIVGAARRTPLHKGNILRDKVELKTVPYLWILVKTQSPLRGEVRIRACYEIFDQPMTQHRLSYRTIQVEHLDSEGRKIDYPAQRRPLWSGLFAALHGSGG